MYNHLIIHPLLRVFNRGRYIYIPINALWCMNTKMALPLMALQYTDLEIDITIRPVKELYTIINTR